MKRTTFWLLISLVTFALGVVTVFVWLDRSKTLTEESEAVSSIAQKTTAPSELPILAYCELANNPEKYDGKIVRVSAKLWFFIHGFKFLDKNCYAVEKEAAVTFAAGREDEIFAKIAKDTESAEYNPWTFPEIVAVGKFSRVKPSRKSDSMVDNAYLQFEILEIEKASEQ